LVYSIDLLETRAPVYTLSKGILSTILSPFVFHCTPYLNQRVALERVRKYAIGSILIDLNHDTTYEDLLEKMETSVPASNGKEADNRQKYS
jgi:hypothetical protein